jgi:hypothetical protein
MYVATVDKIKIKIIIAVIKIISAVSELLIILSYQRPSEETIRLEFD